MKKVALAPLRAFEMSVSYSYIPSGGECRSSRSKEDHSRTIKRQSDGPRHRAGVDDLHAKLLLLQRGGGSQGQEGEGEGSELGEHGVNVRISGRCGMGAVILPDGELGGTG